MGDNRILTRSIRSIRWFARHVAFFVAMEELSNAIKKEILKGTDPGRRRRRDRPSPCEAAEDIEQRRLAVARGAQQYDEFTPIEIHIDAAQGLDGHLA
jgi:hypothetical protein